LKEFRKIGEWVLRFSLNQNEKNEFLEPTSKTRVLKKNNLFLALLCLFTIGSTAQNNSEINLNAVSEENFLKGIALLNELISIPNDSHFEDQMEKNISWIKKNFNERGWEVVSLETKSLPLILVEKKVSNLAKTVLFYCHVDGQPVNPKKWDQENPYQPVLKMDSGGWITIPMDTLKSAYNEEWRIFGRSVSDDKGPLAMFLTAWDALEASGQLPDYNVKMILDFEEELGSPNLPAAVLKHKEKLVADMMLIIDGPRHQSNKPTLSFGARGISTITLTTYGPRSPQHSGHYGNYAPNPALGLAKLLASMKDEQGKVIIPGYYDGINLTSEEKKILQQVPDNEKEIQKKLGIATSDKVGNTYQESIQYPSLNIRGLSSGYVGEQARTIIPAEAIAEIDVRLVPESDPERLFSLIKEHVKKQGYHIIIEEPTEEERLKYPKLVKWEGVISYQAFRTPIDSAPGVWLDKAYNRAFGESPVKIRIGGGSIPISPFVDAIGIPAVTVVTVNPDNNQHSPNENLRLGNFKEGIKTMLAILTQEL